MKAYADQVRAFIPKGRNYKVLGTDGFGRSDFRSKLRTHFEVNRHYIVVAALKALAEEGKLPAAKVAEDKWTVVIDGVPHGPDGPIEDVKGRMYEFVGNRTLVFSQDGEHFAYAARRNGRSVVVADGREGREFNLIAHGTVDFTPDGARMFIADSGDDTVRQVTIPGAVVTTFGTADIDSGFFVGGILAVPGNTLIVMTGEGNMTLRAFTF